MIRTTFVALAALGVAAAFLVDRPSSAAPEEAAKAEPVEKSMHEFMEYYFQPTYKRLKVSMASEPQDSKAWKPIKADSIVLAEGGNLLLTRVPAKGGDSWKKHSIAVREHGGKLYHAAQAKKWSEAKSHYATMLTHCNDCHKQFAKGKYQLKP